MGNIDLPSFLRTDRPKDKTVSGSDDIPDFLKKKESHEPSVSSNGLSQLPSGLTDFLSSPETKQKNKEALSVLNQQKGNHGVSGSGLIQPKGTTPNKKEVEQAAYDRFQIPNFGGVTTSINSDHPDPVGDFVSKLENEKKIGEGLTDDKNNYDFLKEQAIKDKQIELAKTKFISNGGEGAVMLEKLTGHNPDELSKEQIEELTPKTLTGQIAKDKYLELRGTKDLFKKNNFADAALQLKVNKGELPKNDYYGDATKGQAMYEAFNDKNVQYLASIDHDFRQDMKIEMANFPSHHPDYAETIIKQYLSDQFEKRGLNNWFANIPGQGNADKIMDEAVKNGDLSYSYKLLYDKKVRPELTTLHQLVWKSPIATPGIVEHTGESANRNFLNIGKTLANLTGIRGLYKTDADIKAQELEKENTTVAEHPIGLLHKMSGTTGDIVGFVLPMMLGGSTAEAINLVKTKEAANAIAIGLEVAGDYQDKAKLLTDNAALQQVYAATMTGLNMAGAKLLPGQNIAKLLSKEEPEIFRSLADMAENKITTDEAKNKIINGFTDWAKNTVKGAAGGGEFMGAVSGVDDLLQQVLKGNGVDLAHSARQAWEGVKTGFLGSLPIAGAEAALREGRDHPINETEPTKPEEQPVTKDIGKTFEEPLTYEQKYSETEFKDPIDMTDKKATVRTMRGKVEKAFNTLEKLVNCITANG